MYKKRHNAQLRRILSVCFISGTLISCGGGSGGNNTSDSPVESPLGASESVISSAIDDSIVSISAITTTVESLMQARSKSRIATQSSRAFELYDGKLEEINLTARTAGLFASTLNSGWVPDTQTPHECPDSESCGQSVHR